MRDVVIVTSLINGSASWLSVMRVITVSVNVDFVMVSVTRPNSVGAAGNMGKSGCGLLTLTVTALMPTSLGRATCTWCWLPPLRKCAGIIAWKSSLVSGRNDDCCTLLLLSGSLVCGFCFFFNLIGTSFGLVFCLAESFSFKTTFWIYRKRNKNMFWFVGQKVS